MDSLVGYSAISLHLASVKRYELAQRRLTCGVSVARFDKYNTPKSLMATSV
jgi:hypothetical protein